MVSMADRLGFGPQRRVVKLADGNYDVFCRPPAMVGILPEVKVTLTEAQYQKFVRWQKGEMLIQEAFPELSASEREKLMTGLGDEDFKKIAGDDDDE